MFLNVCPGTIYFALFIIKNSKTNFGRRSKKKIFVFIFWVRGVDVDQVRVLYKIIPRHINCRRYFNGSLLRISIKISSEKETREVFVECCLSFVSTHIRMGIGDTQKNPSGPVLSGL